MFLLYKLYFVTVCVQNIRPQRTEEKGKGEGEETEANTKQKPKRNRNWNETETKTAWLQAETETETEQVDILPQGTQPSTAENDCSMG